MQDGEDIIGDIFNQIRAVLGASLLPPLAEQQIEQRLRQRWAGQRVYISKKEGDARALAIRAEFNGRNRLELQEKYGISKGQFYKDLKGA